MPRLTLSQDRAAIARKLKSGVSLSRREAHKLADALTACNSGMRPRFFASSAHGDREPYARETSDDLFVIRWMALLWVCDLRGPPHRWQEKRAVSFVAHELGVSDPALRYWRKECIRRVPDALEIFGKIRRDGTKLPALNVKQLVDDYHLVDDYRRVARGERLTD